MVVCSKLELERVMFAIIQATHEVKVDIVPSSPVLAVHGQEWEKLCSKFGVTSSVVPPKGSVKRHEKLVEDANSKQIVFGTVGACQPFKAGI